MSTGDYPPGARYDSSAPYNEPEIPKVSFGVCISSTLSKATRVETDDYTPEVEEDEDGKWIVENTEDTNWIEAYKESHYTPLELINEFKNFLNTYLPDPIVNPKGFKRFKELIKECEDWEEDELEVVED